MSEEFPRWPPDWVDDYELATEQTVAATDDVALTSALRKDDRLLLAVTWPGGRRWMLIDPVGNDAPQALRIGDDPANPELARLVDGLWGQALNIAKQIMDGELPASGPPAAEEPKQKRRWGRG